MPQRDMRAIIYIALSFLVVSMLSAQDRELMRTYDFVEIIDDQQEEAMFFYENNWMALRELAKAEGYIDSFELHEVAYSEDCPFHLILITAYSDDSQYEQREKNFEKLIAMRGELKLLNEKQPAEFRKIVFGADSTKHRRSSKE